MYTAINIPQQNKLNIPLKCNDSEIKYDAYPNNNTNDVSFIGWFKSESQYLNNNEDNAPTITPTINDIINKYIKSINNLNDIVGDNA